MASQPSETQRATKADTQGNRSHRSCWVWSSVQAASAKLMFLIKNFTDFFFSPGKTLLFNPQPRLQAPPFAFDAVQTSKMTPCNDKICHQDGWGYSRKKNKGTILSFSLEFNTIKTKGNLYCEVNAKYKG